MFGLAVLAAAVLCADPHSVAGRPATECRETEARRAARHAAIAQAREGTILLAHRGAATFAPENTIMSIDAALQVGCQAVKLDFRRTLDGVVVLYHDDRLEHRLDIAGAVETSYYDELMLGSLRDDTTGAGCRGGLIPTLDEVLEFLRLHEGMVHVDVKTPGLSSTLLAAFRKADMLDHVIGYGLSNSEAFQHAAVPQIYFKGALLERHDDLDLGRVKEVLAKPGQVVFLDDPRAALGLLGKPAKRYVPLEIHSVHGAHAAASAAEECEEVLLGRSRALPLRVAAARLARSGNAPLLATLAPRLLQSPHAEMRRVIARNLGLLARNIGGDKLPDSLRQTLLDLLADPNAAVRAEAAVACGRAQVGKAAPRIAGLLEASLDDGAANVGPRSDRIDASGQDASSPHGPGSTSDDRGALIEARGQYAFALGLLGQRGGRIANVLLSAFRRRETGRNRTWLGFDGAMAAWALGKLRVAEAAPLFRETLLWQPPPGIEAADDDGPPQAFVYWDLQAPRFLPQALVEIGTPESLAVMQEILALPAELARRGSPELLARTAAAMVNVGKDQRPAIVAELLSHEARQVRGEAILRCLREPGAEYRRLLERHAAWALPWWDVEHGKSTRGDGQ